MKQQQRLDDKVVVSIKSITKEEVNDSQILREAVNAYLTEEYYCQSKKGGVTTYYHAPTGERDLQTMVVVDKLFQQFPNEVSTITDAEKRIKNAGIRPILLKPVYAPYNPPVVDQDGFKYPNLWKEPVVQPNSQRSAGAFLSHLELMLGNKEKKEWLLDLLAFKYQRPLDKPHQAVYLYHELGGMGKGTLAETLKAVFGETAMMSVTDASALKSGSAVDVWKRTWLVVQEVDVKVGSSQANTLKTMIGDKEFQTDRKYEGFQTHEVPANLVMLSNHAPTFIEPTDRRWFVSKWGHEFDTDQDRVDYMLEYRDWLFKRGGVEAIAGLLRERDVSHYNMAAPPMRTDEWKTCTGLRNDEVVTAIKDRLEDNPEQLIYFRSDFDDLFDYYKTAKAAHPYRLLDAGLAIEPDSVRDSNGKRHRILLRKGRTLLRSNAGSKIMPEGVALNDLLDKLLHPADF